MQIIHRRNAMDRKGRIAVHKKRECHVLKYILVYSHKVTFYINHNYKAHTI